MAEFCNRKQEAEGDCGIFSSEKIHVLKVFVFVDREYSHEGGLHSCKPIRADLETAHFQLFEFREDTFGPGTNHSREKILIKFLDDVYFFL